MLPILNTEDSIDAGEVTEDKSDALVNKAEKKRQEPDISTTEEEEKIMAAPIAVSQSVKDWMLSRRENIRPLTTFLNSANYQVSRGVMACSNEVFFNSGSSFFWTLYEKILQEY